MTRAVTFALLLALSILVVCSAQRRRFNFNFQPPPPRHRFSVEAEGGARGRRNFNVGGSFRGEYDLYRGRDGTRVVASGSAAHGATRVDGTTYKGRPQAGAGIGVEIPIGKGR
uniref:Secreted salivary protein 1024 n=1 Tax=Amblyomma variegatum TaxID=34610 RepID=F0J9R9_AMBVA|nr:TPA_inf: secreted salivary protein 1024 [Amblyomma variegatum]